MDDLLQEFVAETRETLAALSGEIVMWEADPTDRARLDAIFRFVHTVKGSCGFLDLPRLMRLAHAAEDVLSDVRSGTRIPDTHLVSAVLAVVDRIGAIVEAIDGDVALDDVGEDLLIAALAQRLEAAADTSEAAAPKVAVAGQRHTARSVRLSVDLLDRMMSGMSDMVLARNELARRLRDSVVDPQVEAALDRLSLTVAEMRDTVTRTRMQKIDALFSALPRMVRDVSAELDKSVALTIEGADVELDREMIEMIRDPLTHIVRNAIDHGIESPDERRALGKPANGHLAVTASQSGNQIIIELADDGRGIDTDRLIAKLVESGRSEAELRALSDKAKLELIFEPGLSTKHEATSISGRGVGMDIVRANIEQIGGRIELTNSRGQGLRIAIHVPLTLSIMSTIVVAVGYQRFALARQSIEEIVRVRGDSIRIDMLGDNGVATVRERRLPLVVLGRTLGLAEASREPAMLVIVSIAGGSFALGVDSVIDTEELVIKPAAPPVMASGVYAGQTLPDTGRPMLLLDAFGLAADAGLSFRREPAAVAANDDQAVLGGQQALLFVDLDGVRRAAPLDAIDRVEIVSASAIRHSAGRLRLTTPAGIIPLHAAAPLDEADRMVSVLRIADGVADIAYAIGEALDIVTIGDSMVPAAIPGPVAGVFALEGEQIELVDIHWLFGALGEAGRAGGEAPLCLLTGAESHWMSTFLGPVIASAGYRVETEVKPGERPIVALAMDDDAAPAVGGVPLVRLRRSPMPAGDASIYRYDRAALLDAIARERTAL